MDAFSTVNVLMNLYTTVYELFEEIESVDVAAAAIAYTLVEPEKQIQLPPLSPDFEERNLVIIDGSDRRADLSFAFHEGGLVNFNVQVYPKEIFKKKAVKQAVEMRLLPYVTEHTGSAWEESDMGLIARDAERDLIHNVRLNLSSPVTVSASIMVAEFAGL